MPSICSESRPALDLKPVLKRAGFLNLHPLSPFPLQAGGRGQLPNHPITPIPPYPPSFFKNGTPSVIQGSGLAPFRYTSKKCRSLCA